MKKTLERGQALILIALAFIGLASFIGLAVDAGILFSQIGHLRRAVDAAALAAANQFREGRTVAELTASATEFINLNSVSTATAEIFVCEDPFPGHPPYTSAHDPTLCPTGGDPYRKFVRVEAQVDVNLAFLPIIGFNAIPIHANAVSEAASVDLVLAIDTSASEAFDLCTDTWDNDGDGVLNDCNGFPTNQVGPTSDADPDLCNANRFESDDIVGDDHTLLGDPIPDGDREDDCHPFEEIRAAAMQLLGRMYFPYDRMSVVAFAQTGSELISLQDGDNVTDVVNMALSPMQVSREPGNPPCDFAATGDPRGCTNTNTAEGMLIAGNEFGLYTREEAVWIVILLSDGGANAARDSLSADITDPNTWICPNPGATTGQPTWVQPFCRDPDGSSRHPSTHTWFDPDDAARDAADFVGCPDANSPQPAGCPAPGQGAVIFAIGLGDLTVNSPACWPGYPSCDADLGEQLMRYIAAVGDDGDSSTDPCGSVASGNDCGNYYFSPSGAGLIRVFEAIASRIFTRLTH